MNGKKIKFRKANRWIIAGLGALLYCLLKELVFAIILTYDENMATDGVDWVLTALFVILWINGWKDHYVDQGEEGVIKFFGKALLVATLDNGNNWLPFSFSVKPLPTKRKTLNIPATAGERGFQVTSKDGVTMLTRIGVPYWYEDIVAAILNFDPEGDIDMIRDTSIEVMRRKAGTYPSIKLQRHEFPDEFREELGSRLEKLCAKYPFDIDIESITIAKFDPPEKVKEAQERKVIEEGQKEGEIVEADHIEDRIEKRFLYYKAKKLSGIEDAQLMVWAREDVQQQLAQLRREVVEVRGDATNLQKAAELASRNRK